MSKRRPGNVPRGYHCFAWVLRCIMTSMTRKDWRGTEHLPTGQGFIAVSNHVTYADPLTFAHYLYNNGHPPRFLAKSTLFSAPVLGWILRHFDQVPVYRNTARAKEAVADGVDYLARGDVIALFPEGTLTRDPDLWPMVARTGAARMALEADVPVIPVAQWGAQRLLGNYGKLLKPIPRKKVTIVAGPPVPLDDLRAKPVTADVLREATDRIMGTLTDMVADIRGEQPPAEPYNMRKQET